MKRLLAGIVAFAIVISGSSFAFASEVNDSVLKTHAEKHLNEAHYDYKNGSLEVGNVEPITVNDPDGKISDVWAAHVSYQTYRDNIFYFDHTEVVYYDVNNEQILSAMDAAKFQPLVDFKEQYKGELGKKMNLGAILGLLALILIIPGLLMFVWGKQVYSTSKFKVNNNLYNQTQSFN
jgi:hypothetical protein